MTAFYALADQHREAWAPLASKSGNGIWAEACIIHTQTQYEWTDPDYEVPARSGTTMSAAVAAFLAGEDAHFEDEVDWPDNSPCSSAD